MFRVALPTGKLETDVVNFLEERGIFIPKRKRKLCLEINHEVVSEAWFTKPQHIPELVLAGKVEVGVSSTDWLEEFRLNTSNSFCLGVSTRYTTRHEQKFERHFVFPFGQTKIGFFCKKGDKKARAGDIISEFPCLTSAYIRKHFLFWEPGIYLSRGGTETMVISGLYKYGVCTIDTGNTLAENNLELIDLVMDSQVVAFTKSFDFGISSATRDFIKILKAGG